MFSHLLAILFTHRAAQQIGIPKRISGQDLGCLHHQGELDNWEIFLDSPMAIRATGVYVRHRAEYDEEARALWGGKKQLPMMSNVHFSRTSKQSMAINNIRSGAIIMAGSGETVSFAELDRRSNQVAQLLRARGIQVGDTVALCMENHPWFFCLTWGFQRAGVHYVGISSRLTPPEIAYILEDSGGHRG